MRYTVRVCDLCKGEQSAETKGEVYWANIFGSATINFKDCPNVQTRLEFPDLCHGCSRTLFDSICVKIKELQKEKK